MGTVRVLVVDDSLTVRKRIVEVLSADAGIEVVAEAEDGKRAIELCQELRPDIVTLDMMLPVMTGVAATEYIMAYCATPILIVSASTNRGELFRTYDALAAGAVDVLEKPRGDEVDGEWEQRLRAAVKLVARIKVITHPRLRLAKLGQSSTPPPQLASRRGPDGSIHLVALGASTGGPGALVRVLSDIPAAFALPLAVVLHLDEVFGSAFAEWLDGQTEHRVACARDGDTVESFAGRVAMAPPGRHLVVQDRRFRLTSGPPRHSCRPSVDVLFESLALEYGPGVVASLLTGMGRDGAQGLLEIRKRGGVTIAQDEATSVVYGMPREAALLGAAERVLPLDAIGRALTSACGAGSRS